MKQTVLRLVALAAAAGLSFGVVQPAAWADSNSQPVSCDLQADPDSPLCVGDPIFNPDDGDEPRDDDGDEGAQTKPAPGGCYDEYGRWDDSCDVVIDDPQVDPTETCDVAVVTGDDGIDVKVMTCRDEQGNVVYTVTYDAAGCRVKTDAEGNVETECPNPWNQNPVPVCESTDSILDDGTTAWTTVCVDENGNVVYKTYTAHGCTTWADAVGQSETRCEPVCDTQDSTLEDGTTATSTVCVDENGNVVWKSYTAGGCITWSYPEGTTETACYGEGGNLSDDLVYATGGSRGDNCTVCRGGVSESKPVVKPHSKKPTKKRAVAVKSKHNTTAATKKTVAAAKKSAGSKTAAKKPAKTAVAAKKTATKTKVATKKPAKKPAKKPTKKSTARK